MRHFKYKKAVQALNLLATWSGGRLNKMKAIKLIWLADRYHLREYGRPIIQDKYVAMENGPVASGTRDLLQANGLGVSEEALSYSAQFITSVANYSYESIKEPNEKVFSKSDLIALEKVFATYGGNDQFAIRDLSHNFPEWRKFEEGLQKKEFKVRPMSYDDFFLDTETPYSLFEQQKESLELVQKLYNRK